MNIGEASKASGVSAKMIRYYEGIGLLPESARSPAGYRRYGTRDLHVLRFVRQSRDLGFKIDDIKRLLTLWQDRGRTSADVKAIALDHVRELDQRIADLSAMRATLSQLAEACHGDDRPDCPILETLGTSPCCPPASDAATSTRHTSCTSRTAVDSPVPPVASAERSVFGQGI